MSNLITTTITKFFSWPAKSGQTAEQAITFANQLKKAAKGEKCPLLFEHRGSMTWKSIPEIDNGFRLPFEDEILMMAEKRCIQGLDFYWINSYGDLDMKTAIQPKTKVIINVPINAKLRVVMVKPR